jgi:hypothetical protein
MPFIGVKRESGSSLLRITGYKYTPSFNFFKIKFDGFKKADF